MNRKFYKMVVEIEFECSNPDVSAPEVGNNIVSTLYDNSCYEVVIRSFEEIE